MAIEANSPSLAMENQKDAFFLGGLASIDPIFTQYPESLPIHVLPADASSSSSTAPSSPAEVSDPSSCQSDTCPTSTQKVEYCPTSDSVAHHRESQAASVIAEASNGASAQAQSHSTALDTPSRTANAEKSKGAISITPSNTLTFFPPPSNERIHMEASAITSTPVRADTTSFHPTYKAVDTLNESSAEPVGCISDFAPPTDFRAGDWMCVQSHCLFHNYSRNSMCGRCGALNPNHPSARPGFAASRAKKGGMGTKWDAALPSFNVAPSWSASAAVAMYSPFPNSGWSSATLSPPSAATLSHSRNGHDVHQRPNMGSTRLFAHDGPDDSPPRKRGCDTPYPRVEAGMMHTPPLQTGAVHSRGPLDMPPLHHQDRMREEILRNRVRYHLQGDLKYSDGPQQLHRYNVQDRTQSPSPMRPHSSLPAFPMSLTADSQLPSPGLFKSRSPSYNGCRSPLANQSSTAPIASKRHPQSSESHLRGAPRGARTSFGNGSAIENENARKAQASLNDLATTQQLAFMGVGVGPGVNPNVEYPHSGMAASSDLRSPTIREGPPPPPPIINSGSVGPMLVQAGDWICSHCSFVNWRRRRVCMRCYPFAEGNEIALSLSNGALLAARVAAGVEIPESELASLTKPRAAAHLDNTRTQSEPHGTYTGHSSPHQVLTSPSRVGYQQSPTSSLTGACHGFARSDTAPGTLYIPAHSDAYCQTTGTAHLNHAPLAQADVGSRRQDDTRLWQPQVPSAEVPRARYHSQQAQGPSSPAWLPAPLSSPGAFGLEARHKQSIPAALGSPSFSSPLRDGRPVPDLLTPSGRAIKDLWKEDATPSRKFSGEDNPIPISANLRLHFSTTPVRETGFDSAAPDGYASLHAIAAEAAQQPLWSRREGQNAPVGRPAPIGTRPATSSSSSVSSSAAAGTSPLKSSQ